MKTLKTILTALSIIALILQVPVTLAQSETLSAGFMADVNTGPAPLTVHFKDTSGGSPTAWQWDFGDGCCSTQQNPVYTFNEPGTYTVTLTVTDGAQSDAMSGDIVVTNPLAPTPYPGRVPVIVEPILVPVKDPHHGQPPVADPPHKAPAKSPQQPPAKSPARPPEKTPVKSPEKQPQKPPQKAPVRDQPKKSIDKSPQKPPQKPPVKEQPKKSPEKSPPKAPQKPRDDHKQRR